ncbi:unnamed protein product, partial [Sphagnum balticum]
MLTFDHLINILLPALRDFIPQQNRQALQEAIASLKEEFGSDSVVVNQMQLVFMTFQDATNRVLRNHSIKPHWIFALDSLSRSAVEAAIHILSPELEESNPGIEDANFNVMNQNDSDNENEELHHFADLESTSGVSTVNSNRSLVPRMNQMAGVGVAVGQGGEQLLHLQQRSEALKAENMRLWKELIETQETLRELIKSNLNETRSQIESAQSTQDCLSNSLDMSSLSNNSPTYEADSDETPTNIQVARSNATLFAPNTSNRGDPFLVRWLSALDLDEETITK